MLKEVSNNYLPLFLLVIMVVNSCSFNKDSYSRKAVSSSEKIEECDVRLLAFIEKYDFKSSLDSLKEIQHCSEELLTDEFESTINRSLFSFIQKSYLPKLEDSQFDLFYKYPENTVALFNYINDTEKVDEINNGIKINGK